MSGKRKKIEKWDLIKIKNIYSSKDVINIIFLDSIICINILYLLFSF